MSGDAFVKRLLGTGIVGVVGPNGGGKDLLIARLALHSMDVQKRPLLSNLEVLDPRTGEPHQRYVPLVSLKQLLEWDGDMWLSEITTVAGSREASALPVQVQARIQQLRKGSNGSRLWWSAPSFQRADRALREVSAVIVYSQSFLPEKQRADNVWRPRRLFFYKAYDARAVEDFDAKQASAHAAKQSRRRTMARNLYWRPGKAHQEVYRTLDRVSVVGFGALTGTCLECQGKKYQQRCACPDAEIPAPQVVPTVPVQAAGDVTLPADPPDELGEAFVPPDAAGAPGRRKRRTRVHVVRPDGYEPPAPELGEDSSADPL